MTALELTSLLDVQRYARGALSVAGASDAVPVPVEQVAAAANLHPAKQLWIQGDDAPPGILAILASSRARSSARWTCGSARSTST